MIKIRFLTVTGESREIAVRGGMSLMEAAVDNDVPGITADCGGACSCATCHVYVDEAWQGRVSSPSELENDLLDGLQDRQPSSRLSCQIRITSGLDGIKVAVAAR